MVSPIVGWTSCFWLIPTWSQPTSTKLWSSRIQWMTKRHIWWLIWKTSNKADQLDRDVFWHIWKLFHKLFQFRVPKNLINTQWSALHTLWWFHMRSLPCHVAWSLSFSFLMPMLVEYQRLHFCWWNWWNPRFHWSNSTFWLGNSTFWFVKSYFCCRAHLARQNKSRASLRCAVSASPGGCKVSGGIDLHRFHDFLTML